MSDEVDADDLPEWAEQGQLGQLKHSIGNLLSMAKADPTTGAVINITCALIGVYGAVVLEGIPSMAAIVFAIVSLLGIVQWVFRL